MMNSRTLVSAFLAAVAFAGAGEAQRFDPRNNFNDAPRQEREERSERLSHDQLRAIVAREFDVREMRTSGECGREFWALIITGEGRHQWVVLDVENGRVLRTQGHAPACG